MFLEENLLLNGKKVKHWSNWCKPFMSTKRRTNWRASKASETSLMKLDDSFLPLYCPAGAGGLDNSGMPSRAKLHQELGGL